jgi:hypothetical protein
MKTISYRELKKAGACAEQLALFKCYFNTKVVVTKDRCLAVKDVFDFTWAARRFLSKKGYTKYSSIVAPALIKHIKTRINTYSHYKCYQALITAEAETFCDIFLAQRKSHVERWFIK